MTQTTAELVLTLPGGGSTGLNQPPDRVDIDVLNDNFKKLDNRAKDVGSQLNRSFLYYGLAANIGSVTPAPKDGDEYQESDGDKRRWIRVGGVWVTNENGAYLIRPSSVVGASVASDGRVIVSGTNSSWSINGALSSRFRKYRIDYFFRMSGNTSLFLRLRAGSTDYSSATYNWTTLETNGSAVVTAQGLNQTAWTLNNGAEQNHWGSFYLTNPAHAGSDEFKAYEANAYGTFGGTSHASRSGFATAIDANAYDGFAISTSPAANFQTTSWLKIYGMA